MATVLTGAVFGAALVAAGVFQPSVILSQFRLENWHMMQSFLTATACSAILVAIFRHLGLVQLKPRNFAPLGWLRGRPYDGNLVGGLLLGHGMALSGACPGTVLAQVALGVPSGRYALAGATLGGIVWTGVVQPYLAAFAERRKKETATTKKGGGRTAAEKLSLAEAFGVPPLAAWVVFESLLVAVVATLALLTQRGPEAARVSPVAGGLLIGAAQLLSLVLRRSLLGVSTSYEEVGEWFWAAVRRRPPRRHASILFSMGVVAGAWLLPRLAPGLVGEIVAVRVPPLSAFLGGLLMVVGSRMAGGCTSGHGISGMSLLSTSSVITMGTAIGWGMIVANVL